MAKASRQPQAANGQTWVKVNFATESQDGTSIYDVGEAATMEGVQAFLSDPEVRQMRVDAGVDIDSQEVISAVGKFNVF